MARVPVPVAPGQEVGGVQQQFRATPFQNISAPIEAFGGGTSSTLATAAKGLGTLSDDLTAYNKEQDKIQLLKMDAEAKSINAEYASKLKGLEGQVAIDTINGANAKGPGGGNSMAEQHAADLEAIRGKYKFNSEAGTVSAQVTMQNQSTLFKAQSVDKKVSAQKAVNESLMITRIATSGQNAAAAVGSSLFQSVLTTSLKDAASSITDPDVGLKAQLGMTDPKQIALKVQAAQGTVLDNVTKNMLANGDYAGAVKFIDEHTTGKGILAGTETGTQLQAKVLGFREIVKGQQEFTAVLSKMPKGPTGEPSMAALYNYVYSSDRDPNEQARLQSQLTQYKGIVGARDAEAIDGEMIAVGKAINSNQPVTIDMIPTLWRTNPLAAQSIVGTKSVGLSEALVTAENQGEWIKGGGGNATIPEASTYMTNIATSNPKEFLSLLDKKTFAPYFKKDDYQHFEKQRAAAQKRYDDSRGETVNVKQVLGDLGFKDTADSKAASKLLTTHADAFTEAINAVRTPILNAGGTVKPEDIKRAIASVAMKVRTEDRTMLPDIYDYTASQRVKEIGGDPVDMVLQNSSRNIPFVAAVLGENVERVKGVMDTLDDSERTLSGVAAKLGKPRPKSLTGFDEYEAAVSAMSQSAGYPLGFTKWLIDSAVVDGKRGALPRTAKDVSGFMMSLPNVFKGMGVTKEQALELWLTRGGTTPNG
jgi:hypothetical protein